MRAPPVGLPWPRESDIMDEPETLGAGEQVLGQVLTWALFGSEGEASPQEKGGVTPTGFEPVLPP